MTPLEVCLSPALIKQHTIEGKHVVIIDIFRATSCMVTGMHKGAETIIPVASIDECLALGKMGMLMAGEREGKKIEGFDLGNSPFDYVEAQIKDKKIAITTTNGTEAIRLSSEAELITMGSFLNISATCKYLMSKNRPILLFCAGWKGTPCIEDTLFAGALIGQLKEKVILSNDSAWLAHTLFLNNQQNMETIALQSGHAKRLSGYGSIEDLTFCLQQDTYEWPVIMLDGKLQLFMPE